ncbi:SOS response-associated peptidase [Kribbella sp. NPDC026611]|uniref:SOS response-associated peptidase n=1 Tax=Kribbella sp. NPDC026611 TaxID=3154911 RepID=UPI0033D26754
MCGRYASVASRADLLERFVVDESNADELRGQDFNVTLTKDNPVVIARAPQDAGEDAEPARELRAFRWGLLPFWAKDIKVGARMINARAETVHEKPAYRRAFKSQRALIPVDAFYETSDQAKGSRGGGFGLLGVVREGGCFVVRLVGFEAEPLTQAVLERLTGGLTD